jgi:hypothetical protein
MTQWHPIFAQLLRSALQEYYDIQTNVPVGDLPREADIILVRRATGHKPPFRSLWKHLTGWNILEFKGRSESARVNDIDLLVEVGLGIHRRLQEQEPRSKIGRVDVSFWYLANRLGKRFLRDVIELTGTLNSINPGLWRGSILGRPLWLVSNRDVPIDNENAPVRAVCEQSIEHVRELASVVIAENEMWELYCGLLGTLNPGLREELQIMATKRNKGEIDWTAFFNSFEEPERTRLKQKLLARLGPDAILQALTPKQREELLHRLQAESEKKRHTTTS